MNLAPSGVACISNDVEFYFAIFEWIYLFAICVGWGIRIYGFDVHSAVVDTMRLKLSTTEIYFRALSTLRQLPLDS